MKRQSLGFSILKSLVPNEIKQHGWLEIIFSTYKGAAADDSDNATIANAAVIKALNPQRINLDTFLTNARVARTN